jgi:hypothetical protein
MPLYNFKYDNCPGLFIRVYEISPNKKVRTKLMTGCYRQKDLNYELNHCKNKDNHKDFFKWLEHRRFCDCFFNEGMLNFDNWQIIIPRPDIKPMFL